MPAASENCRAGYHMRQYTEFSTDSVTQIAAADPEKIHMKVKQSNLSGFWLKMQILSVSKCLTG